MKRYSPEIIVEGNESWVDMEEETYGGWVIWDDVKEERDLLKAELAALKNDARMLAEYINDENTSRVSENAPNADKLREAADRIIEATKESDR